MSSGTGNAERGNVASGVDVTYIGHASFLWTAPDDTRVLIDPYQDPEEGPAWFEDDFPSVVADLAVSTHDHFDHNAVDKVPGSPVLLIGPGEFETPGIRVTAVPEVHASKWVMPNSLVVVESGGVKFVHCGDNRFDLDQQAVEAVGQVDVVMVAVDDSQHLMTWDEVWHLAMDFSPRVIVPMHYLLPGVVKASSTLLGIENWLAYLSDDVIVRRLDGPKFTFSKTVLPQSHGNPESRQKPEVWVFSSARAAD
jgi:L-ascorbate metabolism protein UlaG (beta-lactamase superfamily)